MPLLDIGLSLGGQHGETGGRDPPGQSGSPEHGGQGTGGDSDHGGGHNEQPYIVHDSSPGCYYPRLEIETLQKDEFQWSLFMQAMRNIQQTGFEPKPASWQEIGGIHGIPYSRWSGDPKGPSKPEDVDVPDPDAPGKEKKQWQGYCFHNSVLFPTWHRAYMLFIEQSLSEEAHRIAGDICTKSCISLSEQDSWHAAAARLRLPFWDWSARKDKYTGLPTLFMEPVTSVLGPAGGQIFLDPNPLSQFIFNEIPADAPRPPHVNVAFQVWKRTYRWATAPPGADFTDDKNITEDYDKLNRALLSHLDASEIPAGDPVDHVIPISSMRDKLRRMFSYPAEANERMWATYYDYFAGTAPQSATNASKDEKALLGTLVSLEDPHNSIHLDTGGTGTMGYDETAGFDPLFFFHHCNVDRLQALWEHCYPDYWLGQGYYDISTEQGPIIAFSDRNGTYQSKPNQAGFTEDTSLPPFRKSQDKYWNSRDVRGPKAVLRSYTYPPMQIEVRGKMVTIDISKPATLDERKTHIAALQEYFIDPSAPAPEKTQQKIAKPPIFKTQPRSTNPDDQQPVGPAPTVPLDGYRDFVVLASLSQYAFEGSHRLQLYVDNQVVNELSVFSRLSPEQCGSCAGRIASGTDFVRGALGIPHAVIVDILEAERCNYADTSDEAVVAAVAKHLHADIVGPDGTLLALHVAASTAVGAEAQIQSRALQDKHWPSLELVSSRNAISNRDTEYLVPDAPFDGRHHGAVLNQNWVHASV